MVKPGQIEEWIAEVNARPESAPELIRRLAHRLAELQEANDALAAENISLRTQQRVAEFENRIASLEYQLEILKRQPHLPGLTQEQISAPAAEQPASLVLYTSDGRILRCEITPQAFSDGKVIARFAGSSDLPSHPPRLLAAPAKEELLCVFDSGRCLTFPLATLPLAEDSQALSWEQAAYQEPRGKEKLAFIIPVAQLALYEYGLQVSQRGFVKKMRQSLLSEAINRGSIGAGILNPHDQTLLLVLGNPPDQLVLVSETGLATCTPLDLLPPGIEETQRLRPPDVIRVGFSLQQQAAFFAVTQTGKVFHRERDWLEPVEAPGGPGKAILNKARLEAGVRIIFAGPTGASLWGLSLDSHGCLALHDLETVFDTGALSKADPNEGAVEILDFTTFTGQS